MNYKRFKTRSHTACVECGDTLAPGEWVSIIAGQNFCEGCREAVENADEFDRENYAEMAEGGWL